MQSDPGADDELVEKVARALAKAGYAFAGISLTDPYSADADYWNNQARAALSVARPAIREECAKVAIKEARELEIANATDRDTWAVQVRSGGIITAKDIAAAIKALP
jgi:hypothetical protein